MPIVSGRLRHKVDIQVQTRTPDGYGQFTVTWADLASDVWCEIKPVLGREYFAAMQQQAKITHKIRMRFRKGITSKHRVLYGNRVFNIESVIDPEEKHQELVLYCTEKE